MSKKSATQFVCNNCGAIYSAWSGRCAQCDEWNTLEEQLTSFAADGFEGSHKPLVGQSVEAAYKSDFKRLESHISEIDNVFGGGLVSGSVNLIAGQPGIGKSTLLLQVASKLAENYSVLYVSAEESEHQVGLRAKRLETTGKLMLATSTSADDIVSTIDSKKYQVVIVDSIQTITCNSISSSAGSVAQITNSTHLLTAAAKRSACAVIIVGHVTKEGSIAGPKLLEHSVDVVLQLEGDQTGGFKLLRSSKNRYGPTSEVGIFEMTESGLKSVENPSASLLAERQVSDGSIVLATIEGSRPILVEVQALVNRTSYGYPKRATSGFDLNRLNLLVAMLEKRTKLKLGDHDIYINVVGGIQLHDPAADLAICMAIGSATKGMALKQNAVVYGELGLSGEVRHALYPDKRLNEAKKLGFEMAIGPKVLKGKNPAGLQPIADIRSALNKYLEKA